MFSGVHIDINFAESYLYKNLLLKHGRILGHKCWEFQVAWSDVRKILEIGIGFTTREDHAGLEITLACFGLFIEFKIYDSRHWDYANNQWEKVGPVSSVE